MQMKWTLALVGLVGLTACADSSSSGNAGPASDRLREVAAPGQDLSRVKVDAANGCYVYEYRGPVETTYLPVRTRDGRPVCTRKQS
ncbi:MAG: hypothetical protein ACU0A2_00360 [Cognatishimia sp.]|jgi:hypothetical protein|uniref:hypothetical protein n=1 Tax=Cognatishimia sp. TaxID=2211648 RepID=UPI00405937F3